MANIKEENFMLKFKNYFREPVLLTYSEVINNQLARLYITYFSRISSCASPNLTSSNNMSHPFIQAYKLEKRQSRVGVRTSETGPTLTLLANKSQMCTFDALSRSPASLNTPILNYDTPKSHRKFLGHYLTGLIEGDGYIYINNKNRVILAITFNIKEEYVAERLLNILGKGFIAKRKTNSVELRFSNKKTLENIINLTNGKYRTPKIDAF